MAGESRPWWAWGCAGDLTERDRRNIGRFNLWLLGWALAFLAATLALKREWVAAGGPRVALALVPSVLALVAIGWYARFLRQADELVRRIHLEALALGFGAGFLFSTGYRLLERAGAPALDVSDALLAMVLCWGAGIWLGTRRYG